MHEVGPSWNSITSIAKIDVLWRLWRVGLSVSVLVKFGKGLTLTSFLPLRVRHTQNFLYLT